MKLSVTTMDKTGCLKHHQGYTDLNGLRYVLRDSLETKYDVLAGNHILFAYEYDRHGAETGLTPGLALSVLLGTKLEDHKFTRTYGGYVNTDGTTIEEHGYLLTFNNNLSPVSLGALAHKIADLFRQESVLAIYESEVTFVYT